MKKNDNVNYLDLIAHTEEEREEEVLDGGIVFPLVDNAVDYKTEYRKQTGKDFETGEIVVQ